MFASQCRDFLNEAPFRCPTLEYAPGLTRKHYTWLACYALLCFAMLCYALLCFAMLCYALLCFAMLCYALLCFAMLCYALLCFAMLCYALLCFAMLCYALLCFAMLCYGNSEMANSLKMLWWVLNLMLQFTHIWLNSSWLCGNCLKMQYKISIYQFW